MVPLVKTTQPVRFDEKVFEEAFLPVASDVMQPWLPTVAELSGFFAAGPELWDDEQAAQAGAERFAKFARRVLEAWMPLLVQAGAVEFAAEGLRRYLVDDEACAAGMAVLRHAMEAPCDAREAGTAVGAALHAEAVLRVVAAGGGGLAQRAMAYLAPSGLGEDVADHAAEDAMAVLLYTVVDDATRRAMAAAGAAATAVAASATFRFNMELQARHGGGRPCAPAGRAPR